LFAYFDKFVLHKLAFYRVYRRILMLRAMNALYLSCCELGRDVLIVRKMLLCT